MVTFNQNKYKEIFERRYGAGSYDAGLSSAREIGRSQAQAEFEKADYERRVKELEKAMKAAQKAQEDRIKLEEKWEKEKDANNQKRIKKGKELNRKMREGKLTTKDMENTPQDRWAATPNTSKSKSKGFKEDESGILRKKVTIKADDDKPKKKAKKKPSLLDDLGAAAKAAGQFFNPFDDVSAEEAVDSFINRDQSKAFQEIARGSNRTIDSATMGGLSNLDKKVNNRTPYYTSQRDIGEGGVTDMLTSGAGYLLPGIGAYGALNATRAGRGLTQFGSRGIGQRLGSEAAKGAITGAGVAGAEVGIREGLNPDDYSASENLRHIGLGAATGAIADPALYGAGKLAQRGLSRLIQGDVPTYSGGPSASSLDALAPRTQSNPLLDGLRPNRSTGLYDQLGERGLRPPEIGRTQAEVNTPRVQENPFSESIEAFNRAVDEQYNYLKDSLANRRGVQQGGVIRDELGEVVDRYGRISENPIWYQEFYAQNGRVPNNTELRQLAEQQVRNGFGDEFGDVPAWRPQEVAEIEDQLEQLNELLMVDPQQEPALRPLIQALEEERDAILSQFDEALSQPITPVQNDPGLKRISAPRVREPYEAISAGKDPGLRRIDPSVQSLAEKQNQTVSDPLASFSSKVDRNPQKEKPFNNLLQRLQTNFTDDMTPLRVLEQNVKGKVGSAEDSLYKQARLFRGSPAKANEIVRTELAPIIDDIQKKGYSYQDLGDYALAVHARDVNSKGMNSGFTNQEVEAVIKKLGTPEMEAARKQLVGVSDRLLDNLANTGVLSKESVEAMREKWPNYMPLFRSFDDDKVDFKSGLSKALANVSSPIKKLEGSDRTVIDPIESMVKNIFQSTTVADRNTVARQLSKLSKADTENKFIRKLESNEDVGRKNVVSVMENGEKVKYEVPPDVYKTMLNMDRESSNLLINILQKPASTLRAGATLTPEFSLRNPMRDVVQAYVVSNSGFNPITDFTYGLVQAIGKGKKIKIGNKEYTTPGKLYQQFIRDNAGYGNIVSMDRNVHKKALENVIKEGNTKKFLNVINPNTYLDVLRAIADVSETATKLGEYRAALRKGVSREEAAYRARDIMDFGRSGSSIREANKVVAFLNANIQGKSKLIRAIQDDWMGVTARSAKAVLLPTLGAFMAQKYLSNEKQQETIEDAPNWLKNSFWLVPVPGTNQVARIPKPFDLAPIFANLPERFLDYMYKDNKDAFDGFAKETLSSYSIPVMLTGLAPIVEGMANYSFFKQGRIIPQREDDIEYPEQHDINTSETAKFLGKGINKLTGGEGAFKNFGSPRIIDNTIRGFTGGLGTYATNAIDAILEGTGVVQKPEKADKLPSQQPIARSFLVNQGSTGASVGKLYDLQEKLKRQRGTAKEKGQEFPKERQYDYVADITKEISDISKKMREIENSSELNGSEKRNQLNKLNEQRNDIARKAVKNLRSME
ncbi:LPD38 domain-containing protein [Metabacillus sp. Hm71]|uniref:LPD38 domain-containing protein n=1 Tax=Metabacillus sp. Hm71 TaxID=3450743 RepID=UPI003F420474